MKNIQDAMEAGDYNRAKMLLQKYIKEPSRYDDTIAILDAAVKKHDGDRDGMREAIRKGLLYNCRNYELYLMLADYYLQENTHQAYLCYENALFYCNEEGDRLLIENLLLQFQMQYKVDVHKVSIIILSYDLLDYTKVCIESIRRTTPENIREIIVVDNGSRDGSVEWLREQADIILIENKENRGFPGGCNQGIKASTMDFDIFLLNNDTMLPENALFWLRMGLYDRIGNGAAGSVSNYAGGQVVVSGINNVPDLLAFGVRTNVPEKYAYENRLFLSGFALLVKRSVLDQVGLLDERFFPGNNEDVDLGLRIVSAGYRNVLCKNSFILHFGSKTFHKDIDGYHTTARNNREKINDKWGFDVDYYLHPKEDLIQLIKEPQEKELHILDIGCGCGASMGYVKGIYPNAEVYGIEAVPEMAKLAGNMGTVICGEIENMVYPWRENFFDYIIVGDALIHLKQPEAVLEKLRKHLKTGGCILIGYRSGVLILRKISDLEYEHTFNERENI